MKYTAIALLASLAAAQELAADQAVATEIAWTEPITGTTTALTYLNATSNPPAPENDGLNGTITASTDADGNGTISLDLTGYWLAKWQNTNAYDGLAGNMGLQFAHTTLGTQTDADGNQVSTEITVMEAIIMTGDRSRSDQAMATAVEQYDMTGIVGFDYSVAFSLWLEQNGLTAPSLADGEQWTVGTSEVLDNGGSGTSQYWQGMKLTATKPMGTGVVSFRNKETYTVEGGVAISKNRSEGERNGGRMTYMVDLAVPEPVVDTTPVDGGDGGDGGDGTGEPTGEDAATALSATAAAAVAIIALTF